VLIPEDALTQWSHTELTMTLGHELVHVRHNDLWYGLVPSVAARLFFFHPLARLAASEYVLAREAACDARTLSLTGAEPADYAQLLLRFGVTSRTAAAVAGASPTFHMLKRRLDMLKDSQTRTAPWRWWGAAVIVGLVTLPFQLTARDAGTTSSADVDGAEAALAAAESSPIAAQQPTDAARERLQRKLEELSERQREVEKSDPANIQREFERQRRLEADAMDRANEQYQRELERSKSQWETAAREYERVTRQQQQQDAFEATARQQQAEAEAARHLMESAIQARNFEAEILRQLETEANRQQNEELKKLIDAARTLAAARDRLKRGQDRIPEPQVDLGTRLRNLELEIKRLADLLEQLRVQLAPKK
jgi:hypothetical protein